MKIMFICTGNICRSAMAHAMLENNIKNKQKNIQVYSCGIFAVNGDIPTEEAIIALKTMYNIDLTKHRATNIKNAPIKEMDIILCATTAHKKNVLNMFPELEGKVYTIKEYTEPYGNDLDIKDPWGYDYDTYKKCAEEINESINKIIEKLQ